MQRETSFYVMLHKRNEQKTQSGWFLVACYLTEEQDFAYSSCHVMVIFEQLVNGKTNSSKILITLYAM